MIVTEIVKMKTIEGISKEEFIDTELLYSEEEEWYMIQHWNSKDELKEASKNIFKDVNAKDFVRVVDKHSVKMFIFSQIRSWVKSI